MIAISNNMNQNLSHVTNISTLTRSTVDDLTEQHNDAVVYAVSKFGGLIQVLTGQCNDFCKDVLRKTKGCIVEQDPRLEIGGVFVLNAPT